MRVLIRLLFGVIVVLFSFGAHAISLGPLSGKMMNHTSFNTSDFEVEVIFQCHPPGIEFEYNKHTAKASASVSADGSYTVPELTLKDVNLPSYLNCTVETYYQVRKALSKNYPGMASLRVSSSGRDIYDGKLTLEFTAIEIDEHQMQYDVSSGISSDDFMNEMGKNFHLSLQYDFSKSFPKAHEQFSKQSFYRWGNYFRNSVGVTSKGIVFLPGLLPTKSVSAEVKIKLASDLLYADSTKQASVNLESRLPDDLLRMEVDLSTTFRPLSPVSALWNKTRIYLTQPGVSNQVYYDAKLKLECNGGVLTGALEPGNPSNAKSPTLLNKQHRLSGYCDGKELGEARLLLEFSDGKRKSVTFKFDRIASCFLYGINGCLMSSSSPEPDTYNHPGAEYSTSLQLVESASQSIGSIQVGISL